MEYVLYKGEVTETYELLYKGYIYYIPMNVKTEKAHKIIDRMERIERIWEWQFENMGKVGIILAAVIFIGIVLLSMP